MDDDVKLAVCPYYSKEVNDRLRCEGGSIKFPDKAARKEIVYQYCSSIENCQKCTLYQMLTNYYDRLYSNGKE